MHYNFVRIHKTLRVTPAMAAGVSDKLWTVEDIANMVDAAAPTFGRPKTCKSANLMTEEVSFEQLERAWWPVGQRGVPVQITQKAR